MDAFQAVAEPNRRAFLDRLARRSLAAGDLVAAFPLLTQPAVSRHLRVLREAGLVDVRAEAQRRIYTLRRDGFIPIEEWLDRYRRFWDSHLDALESHLAKKQRSPLRTKRRKRRP